MSEEEKDSVEEDGKWLRIAAKKGEEYMRSINHPFMPSSSFELHIAGVCALCGEIH